MTEIRDMDNEYKSALEKLLKAENELKTKYPECGELIEAYQMAEIDFNSFAYRHEFCKGFRAGAQLILEIIKPIK